MLTHYKRSLAVFCSPCTIKVAWGSLMFRECHVQPLASLSKQSLVVFCHICGMSRILLNLTTLIFVAERVVIGRVLLSFQVLLYQALGS